MKAYTIDAGGHSELGIVELDGLVYVVGDGYITVWKSLDDFYNNPDELIRTIEIDVKEAV